MKNILVTLTLLLTGCAGMPQHNQNINRSGVVFFGDSIFGKWNLDSNFPGKGYINGGMYGYRTDQLLSIMPAVVSGESVCHGLAGNDTAPLTCQSVPPPATIVIEGGWNNLFQGNKVNASLDIEIMAKLARDNGIKVIIVNLYAYDPAHPAPWMVPTGNAPVTFYDMWRIPLNNDIEKNKGVTLVDLSGTFDGQSDYTLDGIHPNQSGYSQMRDAINAALNRE